FGAQRHHYLPGPQRRPGADRAIRPGPIAAGARAAMMTPCCLQDDRRDAVRRREGWNGLDYVELAEDGQTLRAYFLGKLPPELAGPSAAAIPHLRIEGGAVITGIAVTATDPAVDPDPEHDDSLSITLSATGDFSTYTLRLTDIADLDPLYDRAEFTF